jgi:uncharacterized protein (TIGR04255 family)
MDEICYLKNPIAEAICRVDFLNEQLILNEKVGEKVLAKIKKIYPIAEPKNLISRELQISPQQIAQSQKHSREWNFYSRDRNKRLVIAQNYMYLQYTKYESFEIFEQDLLSILKSLVEEYDGLQFNRFGLRYINHVKINEENPLDWNKYINKKLLSIIEIPEDKTQISRAMQSLELNLGDYNLRFQYGLFNPDYPAIIKKKVFLLDFDAYSQGLLDINDVLQYLPKFHKKIQTMFEQSITEDYRKLIK